MTSATNLAGATVRHALPMLYPGQAQKEFTLNEALARIDLLLHPAITGERASPPADPATGEIYLVAADAVGEFSGMDGQLAGWDGQQWTFAAPSPGMMIRDLSDGVLVRYADGWKRQIAPQEPAGGATVDAEARAAIAELLAALKEFGIFS